MFLKKLVNHSALDSFKSDEITIFGSILHTHIIGKQGLSKIVRDGKEVDYIYNNKYYENNTTINNTIYNDNNHYYNNMSRQAIVGLQFQSVRKT